AGFSVPGFADSTATGFEGSRGLAGSAGLTSAGGGGSFTSAGTSSFLRHWTIRKPARRRTRREIATRGQPLDFGGAPGSCITAVYGTALEKRSGERRLLRLFPGPEAGDDEVRLLLALLVHALLAVDHAD